MGNSTVADVARGLEGVVVAETHLSFIDGQTGTLLYRGIPIQELAEHASFLEVVYLLWYGDLPTRDQLEQFRQELVRYRELPPDVIDVIRKFPSDVHPMGVLRTAVSAFGLFDPQAEINTREANEEKAKRLTAGIPTMIAVYERLRRGQEPLPPDPQRDYVENFLYMLTGEEPSDVAVRAVETYLVLLADHGFNASTFTARVIAATLSDMYSAIAGALGALKGSAHGGANQRVMEMLFDIGEPDRAARWVNAALNRGERIMGIGHRVYKTLDPRAEFLRRLSPELAEAAGTQKWHEIAMNVADAAVQRLAEKNLYPNVDFYSGPVLYAAGIPVDQLTCMFSMSRIAGWTAHVLEQQADNRLIRPRASYVGRQDGHYVPIDQRS